MFRVVVICLLLFYILSFCLVFCRCFLGFRFPLFSFFSVVHPRLIDTHPDFQKHAVSEHCYYVVEKLGIEDFRSLPSIRTPCPKATAVAKSQDFERRFATVERRRRRNRTPLDETEAQSSSSEAATTSQESPSTPQNTSQTFHTQKTTLHKSHTTPQNLPSNQVPHVFCDNCQKWCKVKKSAHDRIAADPDTKYQCWHCV